MIDELAIVELDGVSVHLVLLGRAQALKGNAQSLTVHRVLLTVTTATPLCHICHASTTHASVLI